MRFPYGLADFHALSGEGYFYVDRTDRIRLIEETGRQLLLLRPRRFGKSLWLSTLENYYDLAKADEFERLFGHLKIGQDPTPRRNSYFVMKWDFSLVDPQGGLSDIRHALYSQINDAIADFAARYQDRLRHRIDIDPQDGLHSFRSLLTAVQQSPHRLYLLIDEYDNFANEVMVNCQRGTERYQELVGAEGVIKTLFKAVKFAAGGYGLERVFMTGVSPVVLADITSGYNVAKDISLDSDYADLCGFHEEEIRATLARIAAQCGQPPAKGGCRKTGNVGWISGAHPPKINQLPDAFQVEEALGMMRAYYNGYSFSLGHDAGAIYNPTLALYFFEHLSNKGGYPEEMLDSNLAMDRSRIQYVARLPHGQSLLNDALAHRPIAITRLENRFGVQMMLDLPQDQGFLASLLYYFGALTYGGRGELGEYLLQVPNQVVRKLYVERMQEALLPGYETNAQRTAVARHFYASGELAPLCDFIEQRFFTVFDNRDGRWANELVVKTAFLACLFNDIAYLMDSETAIGKGYADLSLIVRPDMRQYALLDHLLEFKQVGLQKLGLTSEQVQAMPREELAALPLVAAELAAAQAQLARYRTTLEQAHGGRLRLRTHAVVALGLVRLVWAG